MKSPISSNRLTLVVAVDQSVNREFKPIDELGGAKRSVTESETGMRKSALIVEAIDAAPVHHGAVNEFTVDEFGIVHINLDPGESLSADSLHRRHLPFRPFLFTGTLPTALASI